MGCSRGASRGSVTAPFRKPPPAEGDILWVAPDRVQRASNVARFQEWLAERAGVRTSGYDELQRWSVDHLEEFWAQLWEFLGLGASPEPGHVLAERVMPGARWFPGERLNYAGRLLAALPADQQIVLAHSETRGPESLTGRDLREQVEAVADGLRGLGVRKGDRVCGYLPNIPETVIAFLATSSLGAVWSVCPPDFGAEGAVDRFAQLEPRVMISVDGYVYAGEAHDKRPDVELIRERLPGLEHTVLVPYLFSGSQARAEPGWIEWSSLLAPPRERHVEEVDFDHPLWVLFTSGTTGVPKALAHGHGGVLVEHLKHTLLANDRKPDDVVFVFTSSGWVLWNMLVSNLLVGASIVLYDGSPLHPDVGVLWSLAEQTAATVLGCSPALLEHCARKQYFPQENHDLGTLRSLSVTGAPLHPETACWVYDHVKPDLWLITGSGGTDVATSFVGGSPLKPVRAGQMQTRLLGVDVRAYDEQGREVVDEVGELVVTKPMPSMPLFIWGDDSGERLRESYFDRFPGVWRHGDWVKITSEGAAAIYGRSDATINRRGVRLGTSDLYGVVERFPEVADSLVVEVTSRQGAGWMVMFVAPAPGAKLTAELEKTIVRTLRTALSPRHVPDFMIEVPDIPRTVFGKRLEVPIKRLLQGEATETALSRYVLSSPAALDAFLAAVPRDADGRFAPPG